MIKLMPLSKGRRYKGKPTTPLEMAGQNSATSRVAPGMGVATLRSLFSFLFACGRVAYLSQRTIGFSDVINAFAIEKARKVML